MDLIKIARVPAVTTNPECSVYQAAQKMAEDRLGAIVVVNAKNKVVGIFTERDNLYRVTCQCRDPKATLVGEVMTSPVETVDSQMSVDEALAKMIRERFRHLPIVDCENRVIGMASIRYLLLRQIGEKQSTIETLAAYVSSGGPG